MGERGSERVRAGGAIAIGLHAQHISCRMLQGGWFVFCACSPPADAVLLTPSPCSPVCACVHCLLPLLLLLHACREEPTVRVRDSPPLDIVSIDNLPSVLALEASHAFAELLLPALMAYPQDKGWNEAKKVCVGGGRVEIFGGV